MPKSSATEKKTKGFTEDEKAAMKERARELRRDADDADAEATVVATISKMPEPDRTLGMRLHALISSSAPGLSSKLWYGMPAYTRDGNVVCFFQAAAKFKTRYATLAFSDKANLDDGPMWATGFAVKALNAADEARIVALVKKAVA